MDGTWEPYSRAAGSTAVGEILVNRALSRELLVLLPPGYGGGDRYPVLYAHDGQNLFDEVTSNDGEWRVDETMAELAVEGIEAIVVGIPNAGELRAREYCPWPQEPYVAEARGAEYVDFLLEEVRALVNRSFAVDERAGVLGSSLGALVSLYAFFSRPGELDFVAALSPAVLGGEAAFSFFADAPFVEGRVWLDVGDREEPHDPDACARYVDEFRRLAGILERKGYGADRMRATIVPGARHHESAWAVRFPDAMRFWLG